ncbi:MAG: glycosyltransferase family 4 protein [Candidatus Sumerlaeaceae bacterium]|jgi:glycosyltransferase involved in cell wall biosynthesis
MVPGSSLAKRVIALDVRMIEHTGIGAYLRGLLPHLVALREHYQIQFVFLGPRHKLERYHFLRAGGDIVDYAAPIYSLLEQTLFPRLAGVDAYHFPHYNVPLTFGRPFFVTIHDLIPLVRPEYKAQVFYRAIVRLLVFHAAQHAQKVFVPNPWVREELIQEFRIAENKITVLPYAPPDYLTTPAGHLVEATLHRFQLTQPYLLCVSLHKPHKNLDFLLRSFFCLTKDRGLGRELKLVIGGLRAKDVLALEDRIRELQALEQSNRVILISEYLSPSELACLYAGALAVVTTSLLEGFGLPIVEAQKLGVPVIAPDLPWARHTAGDGALFFAPYQLESLVEAVLAVANDANLREQIITRGHANVSRFSWAQTARFIMQAYDESIAAMHSHA